MISDIETRLTRRLITYLQVQCKSSTTATSSVVCLSFTQVSEIIKSHRYVNVVIKKCVDAGIVECLGLEVVPTLAFLETCQNFSAVSQVPIDSDNSLLFESATPSLINSIKLLTKHQDPIGYQTLDANVSDSRSNSSSNVNPKNVNPLQTQNTLETTERYEQITLNVKPLKTTRRTDFKPHKIEQTEPNSIQREQTSDVNQITKNNIENFEQDTKPQNVNQITNFQQQNFSTLPERYKNFFPDSRINSLFAEASGNKQISKYADPRSGSSVYHPLGGISSGINKNQSGIDYTMNNNYSNSYSCFKDPDPDLRININTKNINIIKTKKISDQIPDPNARSKRHANFENSKLKRQEILKQVVAQVLKTGTSVNSPLGQEIPQLKIYGMAMAYEAVFAEYFHKPAMKFIKGKIAPGRPNFSAWKRAVVAAESVGADFSLFVKAQFWAFDAWFSRAPKPREIGSTTSKNSALKRWELFSAACKKGEVDPTRPILSKQRVVVDTTSAKGRQRAAGLISQSVKESLAEQQLRSLMKNYGMTEEEILKLFATKSQAHLFFDLNWLKTRPVYQQLLAAGEL